jgi:hypothetical protein
MSVIDRDMLIGDQVELIRVTQVMAIVENVKGAVTWSFLLHSAINN